MSLPEDLLTAGVAGLGVGIGLVVGAYVVRALRHIAREGEEKDR